MPHGLAKAPRTSVFTNSRVNTPPPPPFPKTCDTSGMSEVQRKVYKGVLMRDIDTVNGANAGRTAILNIVMQLRKCCNHPYLFPNTEDRNLDPMGEHLVENCGKVGLMRGEGIGVGLTRNRCRGRRGDLCSAGVCVIVVRGS